MALNVTQQINELLNQARQVLILSSKTDKGDGLSSALALKLFLKKNNKPVDVFSSSSNKKNLDFLYEIETVKTNLSALKKLIISIDLEKNKISEFNYDIQDNKLKIFIAPQNGLLNPSNVSIDSSNFKYDLIITLGAPDLESVGQLYENYPDLFYGVNIINIDNSAANEHYGQINLIKLKSSSCSEIIYQLIKDINPELIDEQIATNLLAGIIIKTNSFRLAYINPQTLLTTSQLIKFGADRQFIINNLNKNKNLPTLNLWGRILARLKQDTHYKLAWSLISQADFKKSNATAENLNGVVNELIANSPQIDITVLLYETADNHIAGKIYSSQNYDSVYLGQPFNAQGNAQEAAFVLKTNQLIEAEQQVINLIRERIKK